MKITTQSTITLAIAALLSLSSFSAQADQDVFNISIDLQRKIDWQIKQQLERSQQRQAKIAKSEKILAKSLRSKQLQSSNFQDADSPELAPPAESLATLATK